MNPTRARALTLALAAAAACMSARADAQTEAEPPPPTETPAPSEPVIQLVPALLAEGVSPETRRASADELVAEHRLAPLRAALTGEAGDDAAAAARDAIAEAPSAELLDLLADVSSDAPAAQRPPFIDALERAGGRDAIRALVRVFNQTQAEPDVRARAARAIENLTGVPCPADSPEEWLAWWSRNEWLPEADWQTELATTMRRRWRAAADERNAYITRTESLYRRLFSELPPEARTALLSEILTTPSRSLRMVGLELIERSLLNGRPVDPTLAPLTAEALTDPNPAARRLAARSLTRFAPLSSQDAALLALREEDDPNAAEALLELLAAGPPSAPAAEGATHWLATPRTADGAARVIVHAITGGKSPGEAYEASLREPVRAAIGARPGAALIDLLAVIGRDAEGDFIAQLLPTASPPVASACVRALARMPGGYARLASVADELPELRPALADLLSRNASDLAAYRFILRLGGLEEEPRRAALTRLWASLPHDALLPAARETSSPALRALMLRDRGVGELGLPPDARRSLIILYAESLTLAGEPSEAIEAIGMLEATDQPVHAAELAAIALRRLHETGAPPPPPAACAPALWAEAISRLAPASPAAAMALASSEPLRAHIRTDNAAEERVAAVERDIAAHGESPKQASADTSEAESEGPE